MSNTPQKRDPRLVPLSHDHHAALARAREVVLALDNDKPGDAALEALAARLLAWADAELLVHFSREETLMLPPYTVRAGEGDALAAEMARQHADIRALTAALPDKSKGTPTARLRAWSTALSNHVRFEERELFPAVQQVLSDEELDTLGKALERVGPACSL